MSSNLYQVRFRRARSVLAVFLMSLSLAAISEGTQPVLAAPVGTCSAPTVGEVNTAWPIVADVAPGATTLTISNLASDRVGAAVTLKPGDLVMMMQIMDATINTTNTADYGANNGTGTGYTDVGLSGAYEYGRVTAYDAATGLVTLDTPTTGTYKTTGTSRAQVVRIPEFTDLTLTANLTSPTQTVVSSDRVAGGVVAISVSGTLNLNGFAIHSDKLGFLGGAAVAYPSFVYDGTRWTTTVTNMEGGKGHSIAGTPSALQNVLGGAYGQGGPANGGGGGGDVDGPGAGGGNGGAGGSGGAAWLGTARAAGGAAVAIPAGTVLPDRLIMGGGGGGGNGNDTTQTPGGQGGGITIVHAGSITGTGQIRSDGEASRPSSNDASGGAGAGGTVIVNSTTIGSAVTIRANGGGTSASQNTGSAGGGGRVSTAVAPSIAVQVLKGTTSGTGTGAAGNGLTYTGNITDTPAPLETVVACDFGDLPDTGNGTGAGNYRTVFADGYAAHNPVGVRLGAGRDAESDAHQDSTATGDLYDDGVSLARILPGSTSVSVPVDVQGISGTACIVGYLDANGDGDFADAGESATKLTGITTNGARTLAFAGLTGSLFVAGNKKALRVRITTDATFCATAATAGALSIGYAGDGEIEDYMIPVQRSVDISTVKTLTLPANGTVIPGSAVKWSVVVTNQGPDSVISPGVAIADTVPAGVTGSWACVASGSAACPATSGTNLSVAALTMPSGGALTFTFTGTAPAGLTGTTLANTANATVGTGMVDTDTTNNSSTATSPIQQLADLVANKAPTNVTVNAGGTATWTLTMTNNGPHAAVNAALTDVLPAGVTATAVSSTYPGATCSLALLTCSVASLPSGSVLTMSIDTTTLSSTANGTVLTNTASVTSSTQDPNPLNNTKAATYTFTTAADLQIAKGDATGIAGQGTIFPVSVTNLGPSDAKTVTVTDTVPTGLTFDPTTSSSACTLSGSTITCALGTVAAGDSVDLSIGFMIGSTVIAPTITNTASVSSATSDPVTTNNSDSGVLTVSRSANLSLSKQLEADPPIAGDTISWLLTASNAGTSSAQSVHLTDQVPANVTGITAVVASGPAGSGCTVTGSDVACDWSTLDAGQTATVRVRGTLDPALPAGTEVVNSADISSATPDPDTGDNTSTDSGTSDTIIDLRFSKTVAPAQVNAGEDASFTIEVTNVGLSTATNVVVADTLPTGATLSGAVTATTGSCTTGATITCSAASLAPNATMTITIPINVSASIAAGPLTNSATLNATGQPPATTSATLTVTRSADISLTKTAGSTSVNAGSNLEWVLVAHNDGPSDASDVVITDTLPVGSTVASLPNGCTASGTTVTCTSASIASGADASFTITVAIDPDSAAGASTNQATVTSSTPDPDSTNNLATADTTITRSADLKLNKADTVDPASAGNVVNYILTITNAGPSTATSIVVTDTLPAGLTFVAAASDPSCVASGSVITCTLPGTIALSPGAHLTLGIAGRIDPATVAGSSLTNSAHVTAAENDPAADNNTDSEKTSVDALSSLTLQKSNDSETIIAGTRASWTLTLLNAGPSVARDTVITDTLPAGVTFVAYSASSASTTSDNRCTAAGSTVTCDLGDVPLGTTTIKIFADVPADATSAISNSAKVVTSTAGNCEDGSTDPGCTATTPPIEPTSSAALSVSKSLDNAPIVPGTRARFKIVVANAGPSVASNVTVIDSLQTGLTFVPHDGADPGPTSSSECVAFGPNVVCGLGTVAVGSVTLYVVADVVASRTADVTNTASLSSTTGPDCDMANLCVAIAGPYTPAPSADLSATKTLLTSPIVAGQLARWEVVVHNAGPSDATEVTVADTLDSHLTFDASASDSRCEPSGQDITCALGTLPVNESVTFEVAALVAADTPSGTDISNTVTTTSATPDPDPTCSGCTAGPDTVEAQADLSITKSGSSALVAGTDTTYQISVSNAGPSSATAAVVTDTLPAGMTAVSAATTAGSCSASGTSISCDVGALAPGQIVDITVTARVAASVAAGATLTNNASLTSDTTDTDETDNQASVDGTVARTPGVVATKTASTATAVAGEPLSYTITVDNTGPSDATSVTVSDPLPAGFVASAVSPAPDCALNDTTVDCSFDSLASGATKVVTISGTVAAAVANGSSLLNTASVSCAAGECTPTSPSVETSVVTRADLETTKTLITDPVIAGQPATWRVTVTNHGPSVAANVAVGDTLDALLTYVAADSDSRCAANGQDVSCAIGALTPGQSTSLDIVANVSPDAPEGESIANGVTTTSDTVDPDTSCPGCVDPGTPTITQADMVVVKTAAAPSTVAGTNATWNIDVHNAGPSTARTVSVVDVLADQLTFVAADSDPRCSASGVTVTCALGDLAPGADESVTIVTSVESTTPAGTTVSNTASVTTPTTDPAPECADCTATIGVTRSADLVSSKRLLTDPLVAGSDAEWELTVENQGPSEATGVTLTDELDPALTFDPAKSDARCSAVGQDIACNAGTLAVGESATFIVHTLVAASTPADTQISNAVVAEGNEADPDPSCDLCTAGPASVTTSADVSLTKSGSSTMTAGLSTTYQLSAANTGPSDANDVVVTDPMPTGMTATSATSDRGPCSIAAGTVTCALGTLAPGAQVNVTIEATLADSAAPGSTVTNTATVATSTPDSDDTNDSSSVSASVLRAAGVTATKTASAAEVVAGGPITYTITAHNSGPSVASTVTVTDEVPAEVVIDSVSPSASCTIDQQNVICTFGEVAVDASPMVTINGHVRADVADGASITNAATVECGDECPTVWPEVTTAVRRSADLVTVKRQLTTPLVAGMPAEWEITVTNNGPSVASTATATDTLHSALTFDGGASDPRCGAAAQVVTCSLGDMEPGAVEVLKIVADVDADTVEGTTIPNTVSVTSPTGDPDPTCPQCVTPGTPVTTSSDLRLAKSAESASVVAGTSTTWHFSVKNQGPSTARSVTVTDVLDSRLTFSAALSDPRCGATGQTITCQLGDMADGAVIDLAIVTSVDSDVPEGTTIANQAATSSPTTDPDASCTACGASIDVTALADLVATKTIVTDPIVAGSPVRFRIDVRNDGPSTARSVVVSDDLAAGLTFTAGSSTPGCSAQGQTVSCTVGDILNGATATVYIEALLDSATADGAALSNTASITSPTTDPNPLCPDCTTGGTVTRVAHTWVVKSGSSLLTAGVPTQWDITYGNDGPSDAADVVITDHLPAGLESITVDAPTGAVCDVVSGLVTCNVANLASGARATIVVHATPKSSLAATPAVTNTATITAPSDPDGGHSSSVTSGLQRTSQVSLAKIGSSAVATPGTDFVWTLTATNLGPSDASGVTITDQVPAEMVVESVDNPGCSISGQTVTCVIDLAASTSEAINVTTHVDPAFTGASIVNTAALSCPGGECTDVSVSSGIESMPEADVVYSKKFEGTTLTAGTNATFTLSAHNNGPSDAHGLVITDQLLDGLTFVAADSDSRCSAAGGVVTCTDSLLAADADTSFKLVVKVASDIAADVVTNAITGTTDTSDPDPSCAECVVTPIPVTRSADVDATKELVDPLVAGSQATYSVLVVNHGPSTATGLTVTDPLAAGLTFDSAGSSAGCVADSTTGAVTCPVPDLAPNGEYRVTISVMVDAALPAGQEITNTVTVDGEIPDPEPTCTRCTTTNPVSTSADLVTDKVYLGTALIPGETARWQVTVTNRGPSAATDVQVTDQLHAALTFDQAKSDPVCSAMGQDVTCALGTIAVGSSKTVIIAASVDQAVAKDTVISNTVVTKGVEPDPDPSCAGCTTTSPTATPTVDLELVMAGSSTVVPGEAGTFQVTVTNHGPSAAADSKFTISLPAQLFDGNGSLTAGVLGAGGSLLAPVTGSTDAGDCSVSGRELICPIGLFAAGATLEATIHFTAPPSLPHLSQLVFSGLVTSAATETNPDNNVDDLSMTAMRSSTVSITKSISDAAPVAGTSVTWTISVHNGGSSDAANVAVADTLPEGVVDVATEDGRCTINDRQLDCMIDSLAAGADTTIVVTGTVSSDVAAGTALTNSAMLRCDGGLCPDTGTEVTGEVATSAEVTAVKSGDAHIVPGTDSAWKIVVSNAGPSTARSVTVTDILHEGLTVVTESLPAGCEVAGQTVTCAVGDLAAKTSATIEFTTSVAADLDVTELSNSVAIDTETPTTSTGCDGCTVTVPVEPQAKVTITKTATADTVQVGGNASWDIVVANDGPSTARSVVVTDNLDEGLTFVSDSAGRCTASGQKVTCQLGDLAPGAKSELTLTASVDKKSGEVIENTAEVSTPTPSPEGNKPVPGVSGPIAVTGEPALAIVKEAIGVGDFVAPGEVVTYQITVTNSGESDAHGVSITDNFPSSLRFNSGANGCSALARAVTCSPTTVAAGSSYSASLTFTVLATSGEIANEAVVESDETGVLSNRIEVPVAVKTLTVVEKPSVPETLMEVVREQVDRLAHTGASVKFLMLLASAMILIGVPLAASRNRRSSRSRHQQSTE